jgi:ASC-1-like (ASCH) protein
MTEYNKDISEPWFSFIKYGIKTVEGRLNKGDWQNMKIDDFIIFNNKIKVLIVKINEYDSFEEYLKEEGLYNCLPDIQSIEEGIAIYNNIYPNNIHKIKAFKICLIRKI